MPDVRAVTIVEDVRATLARLRENLETFEDLASAEGSPADLGGPIWDTLMDLERAIDDLARAVAS